MRRNDQAALIAAVASGLILLSGYTGARSIERLLFLLADLVGPSPFLRVLAYVLLGIASLGGFGVLLGAYLIWNDRVRFGRVFILLGSGAGLFTLVFFLAANLRREEFSFLASVLPAIVGVALGVVARFYAVAKPIV